MTPTEVFSRRVSFEHVTGQLVALSSNALEYVDADYRPHAAPPHDEDQLVLRRDLVPNGGVVRTLADRTPDGTPIPGKLIYGLYSADDHHGEARGEGRIAFIVMSSDNKYAFYTDQPPCPEGEWQAPVGV